MKNQQKLTILAGVIVVIIIAIAAIFALNKDDAIDTDTAPTNEVETKEDSPETNENETGQDAASTNGVGSEQSAPPTQNESGIPDYNNLKADPGYRLALGQLKFVCDSVAGLEGLDYSEVATIMIQERGEEQEFTDWFEAQTGTFQKDNFFKFISEYSATSFVEATKEQGDYDEEALNSARDTIKLDVYDICSGARTLEEVVLG